MKNTGTSFKYLFFTACFMSSFLTHAMDSNALEKQADSSIKQLYHTLDTMPNTSMAERIDWISKHFKGSIYVLGSLGEGHHALYDQFPRYRIDAFDCDTYVNTVIALAIANSLKSFQQCLKFTRYKEGKVSYLNRNHFTSLDWNGNNQQRGLLKDITLDILDQQKHAIAQFATALINKPAWYAHKTVDAIRLQTSNTEMQKKRLAQLKTKGSKLTATPAKIPYIPLTALFLKNNQPNFYIFSQIPNGAIIEIVRPNWDLRQLIGTSLNVSHMGFVIWRNKQLYFREASSQYGKVVDVPLIDYLQEARKSPTIKGINIQIVIPQKPIINKCDKL